MNKLCILFLPVINSLITPPPSNITNLIKKRISTQWTQNNTDIDLVFDNKNTNCNYKGVYRYLDNEVILQAQNRLWSGKLYISFTELLENKNISFPPNLNNEILNEQSNLSKYKKNQKKPNNWKKTALTVIAGAIISGFAIKSVKKISKSKAKNTNFNEVKIFEL